MKKSFFLIAFASLMLGNALNANAQNNNNRDARRQEMQQRMTEQLMKDLKLTDDQKARLRLKSGSMDGVLCYSGYVLDEEGKPSRVFSLMVNGAKAKTAVVREALGALIEAML